ncbi:MAG: 30S ribosomal protein S15 [Phycisphaeraceae bacterium]|nr:30S ribosomal protein S15 [Phycisphaeraceae bacterium]MCW5755288.1 30S ribosomal protein S15 [Phycisphaeraceae bacterium]
MISAEKRKNAVKTFARHDTDTGSPEVQISVLTERIKDLAEHIRSNRLDFHSRRGLVQMVSKRNKLLRYLARTDAAKYQETIKRLGLRK